MGATAIYAAVRADRATPAIRNFPTFTSDLHALADWLKECQVTTVAMESTGVYWIPVFQILEARGFEVVLVNARLVRSVPGRKSDVADCEWLRHLHSVVQLHHAISDLTGVTGMAITDAILGGERDPARLAALADRRIKASRDTLIKALRGDWRPEHLFTLEQARETYAHYQQLIDTCDKQIKTVICALEKVPKTPPDAASAGVDSTDETTSEGEAPRSPSTPETERFVLRRRRR